jgi:hypothetical protein
MYVRRIAALLLTVTALAMEPRAVEAGDGLGLVMGFPTAVGVLWQTTDRFALRPEFSIAHNSSDFDLGLKTLPGTVPLVSTSNTTPVGVAISALFRTASYDAVRVYVSPRFEYAHVSGSASSIISTGSRNEYAGGGAIGAQYNPAPHFGVFGEIGAMYSHSSMKLSTGTSTFSTIGTRGRLGVILFF